MTQETVALNEISRVTDQELITRLRLLVRADQKLNARLLVHLGEVDARGLYRDQAYPSMFAYCVEQLQMSEAQAYLRIQAARLGRQFPLVLQHLAQGSLHLTAIKLLGPHLTADNHVQLLERARCKGKREIELLVAAIAPKPDVPSRMRKLPETGSSRPEAPIAPTPVEAPLAQTLISHEPRELTSCWKRHRTELRRGRSVQADTSWSSRLDRRCTTSWCSSRICCVIRCRTETWPSSSSVRWIA